MLLKGLYLVDTLALTFDDLPFAPRGDPTKTAQAIQLAGGYSARPR